MRAFTIRARVVGSHIRHHHHHHHHHHVNVARFASSDIKICLFDGTTYPSLDPDLLSLVDTSTLVVLNKRDLLTSAPASVVRRRLRERERERQATLQLTALRLLLYPALGRWNATPCDRHQLQELRGAGGPHQGPRVPGQVIVRAFPPLFFLNEASQRLLTRPTDVLLPTRCSFESGAAPDGAVVTRARHKEHLERCLQHLRT